MLHNWCRAVTITSFTTSPSTCHDSTLPGRLWTFTDICFRSNFQTLIALKALAKLIFEANILGNASKPQSFPQWSCPMFINRRQLHVPVDPRHYYLGGLGSHLVILLHKSEDGVSSWSRVCAELCVYGIRCMNGELLFCVSPVSLSLTGSRVDSSKVWAEGLGGSL